MGVKLLFKAVTLYILGTTITAVGVSDVSTAYELGTWGNFCKCAITHGFDDNMNLSGEGQDIFDERGFHFTLHVQTGSVDWDKCKASFAKGHEIASHSVTNQSTSQEFRESREAIRENVPGEMCVTIAYPDCKQNGVNITPYYIAGRNCDGRVNSTTPVRFEQISAKMFGTGEGGNPGTGEAMNAFADEAASQKGWAVYCHHGIGDENHPYAVTSISAMKSHLDYLDENRDKFWVETFGNVARYIKERDAATISLSNSFLCSDSDLSITVTTNLTTEPDDTLYNYPLTIRRLLPEDWDEKYVEVNRKHFDLKLGIPLTKKLKHTIVTESSRKYIMFDVVPNVGAVCISCNSVSKRHGSVFSTKSGMAVVRLQDKNLLIDRNHFSNKELSVSFCNLKGKVLARHNLSGNESQIVLPADKINRSAFIVKISDGSTTYTRTFMPQL